MSIVTNVFSASYDGTVYSVTAVPDAVEGNVTYEFSMWSGVSDGDSLDSDVVVIAVFKSVVTDYNLPDVGGNVVSDLSGNDRAEVTTEFVDRLKDGVQSGFVESITIVMTEGSLELDSDSIMSLAGGETITIGSADDLLDAIVSKVSDRPVFDVSVGDIHEFNGSLNIRLRYALATGEMADNLQVWHFKDDGSYDIEQCRYEGENVIFSTDRLSYFSIMHVEPPADDIDDDGDDGGSSIILFAGVGASAVVLIGIAVFFLIRRKA